MRTILTRKIDGYDIIIGFGVPVINPIETRALVGPILFESGETRAIKAKNKEVNDIRKLAKSALDSARVALQNGDNRKVEDFNSDYRRYNRNIAEKMEEFAPLKKAYEARRRELMITKAIYFEPKEGERVATDDAVADINKKLIALDKDQKLDSGGVIVPDFRGKTYHLKGSDGWTVQKIESLGEVPEAGAVEASELTPDQQAEIADERIIKRIAGLSAAEKTAEKVGNIDSLATQAAFMRSKLEIQGATASKALADSKTWYESEVSKVELKYV